MTNADKGDIKERIDTNKDYIVNINEINDFIFDNEEGTNNLNELGNYLNGLSILQNNTDIIKRALMGYFLSNEWSNESKKIGDKVKANQPLEKRELTLLYLQMIDVYSRTGNKYQGNFDPNKPASGELLTFIKKQYNHPTYNPQTSQSDAQKFQDNQRKDKSGLYTKETQTNIEIPQIPELNENNEDYIYNYCYKLMDWAEANFANDIANIRQNAKAKHYDVNEDKLGEYARYDILLFAFEKYCESISKDHENLVKQAGYKNNEEFQQQVEELGNLGEEIQSKYPNLDEALNILQKFGEEVENNKKKYFRNDDELDKAQQDAEEFNNFLETKTKEYKIDDIKASMEKNPETSEEAMAYCDGINKIIEYQEELTQKSESYGDSIKKYQKYIEGNVEISKKYPNINKYIEVQKQYSEFIKGGQNKIDFNKYEKYNQLKEDSGIDKDFHNMSVLGKIIMNPLNEHFPILGVKNAAAEKQKKIDAWRDNLQKKSGPAYRLLTSFSGLLNGFISATVGVGTGLGYMILSLCGKDTAELNKRKQFYDNLLKANQSSQQNEPVYDPDSNSINLNWHNGVSTVSSSIAQMLVLITGGSSIFGKGFSKIAGATKNVAQGAKIAGVTKNVAQGAKIAGVTEGIAHRVGIFSMSFITNIGQSFQEAKNENLDGGASLAYSMLTSIIQSSLELLSPNEILVGGGSNITKELIKNLVKDGSKNSFMMLGKAFLKNVGMEIVEENLQEGLQLAAGNLINMYADNKRGTELGADWSWKNFAQTAIITTLTTGITTGTSYMLQMGNMSENDRATLFNKVVNNEGTYNAVMEMLNKAISGEVKIPNTDITSLQQLKTAFLSVNELGSNLHDAWRNTQVNEDGTYKPKIETTEDKAWIEQHDGQTEVDIVNTPFEELPSDWQHENLEAAKVAESLVYDVIARGDDITPEMIEDMSRKVHEERRKRNPGEKSGIWDMPYEELPESEKVKDRNQILLAIEVTKRNLDNDYFNGKTHKFNVSGSQARSNSTVMDNTLNEINEKNKSKKLKQLGEEISKQYEKATGEKIELTEEQLLSVLDAHEQDGVLGELTTGQLKKKVSILSETITNPRVRRFLLEAGFCGSMANMLQAAQNFYQRNQTTIDDSIDLVGRTINNAYKSSKKGRKEYTIGEEVNVPRSDGSITYGAHIESYDPSTGTYLVVWYQNGQGLEKRVSTEELNSVNGGTIDALETFDTATGYKVGQQIYVIKNDGSLGQAKITEIYKDKGSYKVEWQEDGKNKFYFFTKEELDNANSSNTQIQTEELNNINQENTQAQEKNTQIEETHQFESEPNTQRREMSEVPRGCDVVAIGDLHGEYVALKGNLEYAGVAKEVNGHLQWTGGNKKVVFQGDILSDRGTDGLKIINEIHQLRQQARSQGGDIDIIVGNHDDFMISYLTGGKGTRFGTGGPLFISMIGIERPQGMGLTELAKFVGGNIGDFDSLSGRNSNQQILQAMRYSREGRVILEEMCNMKIVSQIDDVLYCHTNPTKEMLQYLTNGNLQQNIDILNQKYQGYLRNILLGENVPCITSKEFNKISDLFLNTGNRDIGGIEKYVDQLRNSGINMISHGHSGGHGEKNGQLIYNIDHTVYINGLKIVDNDFSYGKCGDTQRSHSISVIQQNGGNVITGDKAHYSESTQPNGDYFGGKSHKIFEGNTNTAQQNSLNMDNILNDINEQNRPVMLQRLREEINRQYKKSTGQELQLTDEQLLSVLDAHEQDGIIGELTTGQLKQKVETLDKTITDPNIRRFLLESGFCGKGFLNIFHNNEHTQQTPPQPGIKFQYESLDQKLMEQFDRYTPKTDRAKLFLRQGLYPTNRMFLGNNIIYLTDQIIDKYGRSMIIGYSWSKENNTIDLRLFYKSQSEGCRRACPGQRTDGKYSKGEFLTDFSYETTTKIHPKIGNYFDNLNKVAVNRSPILDILGSVNGGELLTKEMETSIHVQEALFPTMRFNSPSACNFYKNKQSSYVIDSYNNLIPQGLDYKHMSNNPNKAYSYTHEYLGEIEVQVCTMKRYDRDIDIHFAHAKSSPDQVRIDNVVSSKARINSFGVYDYQINAGPLAAKPIDYNSQVPIDYRDHTTIPGTNYIDIRALYQNNPIIKAYKKNILKRTNK